MRFRPAKGTRGSWKDSCLCRPSPGQTGNADDTPMIPDSWSKMYFRHEGPCLFTAFANFAAQNRLKEDRSKKAAEAAEAEQRKKRGRKGRDRQEKPTISPPSTG